MVWPTLGSRKAKEQEQEQYPVQSAKGLLSRARVSVARWCIG